jgi:hypothetical protein
MHSKDYTSAGVQEDYTSKRKSLFLRCSELSATISDPGGQQSVQPFVQVRTEVPQWCVNDLQNFEEES